MFKRVLVTLDGSSFSEVAVPQAAKFLIGAQAEVLLYTVADEPPSTVVRPHAEPLTVGVLAPGGIVQMRSAPQAETKAQAIARVADELRDYLMAKADPLERAGIRYHTAVGFGDPAEEIIRCVKREGVDLIMMATHGHTGLSRLVFGSVASSVVASGVCPVMLVRPDGLQKD